MSTYFIANIRINDPQEYDQYISGSEEVFKQFKGKYITVDDAPTILEGRWDYTRLVLIQFANRESFEAWYHSPAYQRILAHRLKAADCDSIVVDQDT